MNSRFLKSTVLILSAIILSPSCEEPEQNSEATFIKTLGGRDNDIGYSVQQTLDGGYIIGGYTSTYESGSEDSDVLLIKTDTFGDAVWTRTYGGSDHDEGKSVQQTTDGGYIIVGRTASYGAGIWLIKTDTAGDTIWTRTFGGPGLECGYSVQQTMDEGYIISGYTTYEIFAGEVWLIKTDALGDTVWTRICKSSVGGRGRAVKETSDGGYIVAGSTYDLGAWLFDALLIKTDASGQVSWVETFDDDGNEEFRSVQQTSDRGYILTGETCGMGADRSDVWLIKTDEEGEEILRKTFGGDNYDEGHCIQQTSDGGYIIVGKTESYGAGEGDVWLIKTNASGDVDWTRTYGGSDVEVGYSVQQTSDGGYIIAGETRSCGAGWSDVLLIKTDENGNTVPFN